MRRLAGAALIALVAGPCGVLLRAEFPQRDAVLSAAFVFNFAKYTDWPNLADDAPIVACVFRDDAMAAALSDTVRGQKISEHSINVRVSKDQDGLRLCHLLFVGAADTRPSQSALAAISALPVLTVSDSAGFARAGGIIEMYVEDGRIHFAINVTAIERSGLHLSPRLLNLARIVRGPHAP